MFARGLNRRASGDQSAEDEVRMAVDEAGDACAAFRVHPGSVSGARPGESCFAFEAVPRAGIDDFPIFGDDDGVLHHMENAHFGAAPGPAAERGCQFADIRDD